MSSPDPVQVFATHEESEAAVQAGTAAAEFRVAEDRSVWRRVGGNRSTYEFAGNYMLDAAPLLRGLDLSVYQRARADGTPLPFDPEAVAAAGYVFAVVRLGHGVTLDAYGADSVRQLRAAGVLCSGYWYQERVPPDPQAEAFLRALDAVELDFVPWLDVEAGGDLAGPTAAAVLERMGVSGRKPGVYTMPGFSAVHLVGHGLESRLLWEAHWTSGPAPTACAPWPADAWVLWQHDNRTVVPGIAAPCDVSKARGLPTV